MKRKLKKPNRLPDYVPSAPALPGVRSAGELFRAAVFRRAWILQGRYS